MVRKRKPRKSTSVIGGRLFHFTRARYLRRILTDKQIKQSPPHVPGSEKPTVWFSYRRHWEPTATPQYSPNGIPRCISFDELAKLEAPVRIEIDPSAAPLTWTTWKAESGVSVRTARTIELTAADQKANPAHWRMSFDPVGIESWLAVEVYFEGRWQGLNEILNAADNAVAHEGEAHGSAQE